MTIPSLSDIKRAHTRISKFIYDTPVVTSHSVDEMCGAQIFFKCENLQKTGSFKMRGATNTILSIRPEERQNGIATHSSGNHAQAVANAANAAGNKAYIVIPKNAAKVKIDAVKGYGGEVILCEPNEKARIQACSEIIEKTGAVFVPPFDHPHIIAGQATAAKELLEETPDLDSVLTPVGGGGLSAGTALSVKYIIPNTQVILAEPAKADDAYKSFNAGKLIPVKDPNTIADGLKTSLGKLNFEIIKENVSDVVTVSEKQIVDAMRIIWERMKIIVEPSSAVPLAAVLKDKKRFKGQKVGIILTGGNVDLSNLPF
ncbi:MAG: pyridoxal-phosphate dependent enzyme [Cyclobacteriaceae bacterium]